MYLWTGLQTFRSWNHGWFSGMCGLYLVLSDYRAELPSAFAAGVRCCASFWQVPVYSVLRVYGRRCTIPACTCTYCVAGCAVRVVLSVQVCVVLQVPVYPVLRVYHAEVCNLLIRVLSVGCVRPRIVLSRRGVRFLLVHVLSVLGCERPDLVLSVHQCTVTARTCVVCAGGVRPLSCTVRARMCAVLVCTDPACTCSLCTGVCATPIWDCPSTVTAHTCAVCTGGGVRPRFRTVRAVVYGHCSYMFRL